MTDFSRRTFVKGGALIVGLSVAGTAQAANDPKAASPSHTGLNPGPPDPRQIDSWIAIHADNTATIYSGRVNLGQGTPNGLLMIAGEELDMGMSQLKWVDADSNVTPDSGVTVGSSSIRTAMNGHLCRCGTYPRILTAIHKAAAVMAKGGKS